MNYNNTKEEPINNLHCFQKKDQSNVDLNDKIIANYKQKVEELSREIDYYKSVLNTLVDSVYVFNPDTNEAIFWNQANMNILGYSYNEMKMKLAASESFYKSDDLKRLADAINDCMKYGYSSVQAEVLSKDGSYIPFEYNLSLMVEAEGKSTICVVGRDITNRKKAVEDLKESKNQLEELNATKDKLFSIIGHDLRSPIGSFKQLIELILSNFDLSDTKSITELLQTIQKSASTTYDLLENLLVWANSQRNDVLFMPVKVNLFEIINTCTLLLSETARSKGITIHNQISPNQLVFADQNMLMTILRNLLTNAIKFTHQNNNIYLSAIDTEIDTLISVRDEGVGINSKNFDNLFKSTDYYTTYGTSGEKGTGLGLLLCKEFVEKHAGKIWVESEEGRGSIFNFNLPF